MPFLAIVSAIAVIEAGCVWLAVIIGATGEEIIVGYGPLGVMTLILLAFARSAIDRLIKDRDAAVAQNSSMSKDMFTEVIPVVRRAVEVLEKRDETDREIIVTLKEVRKLLERTT